MRTKFGNRFISPRELWDYAHDLRIVQTQYQETLLGFLERERLLLPVARIECPAEIFRHFWLRTPCHDANPDLPVEKDMSRIQLMEELQKRLSDWSRPELSGSWLHPLDEENPDFTCFITKDISSVAFRPWDSFKIDAGLITGESIDEKNVKTYYHYWQVFMLAEILATECHILYNFRDKEVSRKIRDDGPAGIAKARPFMRGDGRGGLRGYNNLIKHRDAFEAVAFVISYTNRALTRAAMDDLSRKNGHGIKIGLPSVRS